VDGAGTQLDLLGGTVDEEVTGFDPRDQLLVEGEVAVEAEDVGDEVVGEGGEAVEVTKDGEACAGDVGGDLGALEERDLALHIYGDVGEGPPGGEGVSECEGGAGGGVEGRSSAAVQAPCSRKRSVIRPATVK
jgi:hypothetical protein